MFVQQKKTISDTVNSVPLILGYSGYAQVTKNVWFGTNIRPSFNRLYFIESGEGFLQYDGETVSLKPGMAYLIPVGLDYSYYTPSEMQQLFFHFNIMKPDHYDLLQDTGKVLQIPFTAETLQRLLSHYNGNGYFDGITVKRYIYQFLDEFQEIYGLPDKALPEFSHHVMDTIDYIHDHLSAALRIEDLAQRLFVSKSYLTGRFRKEVGVPLGRYIDDQLLFAAQRRLDQTDDSIAKISKDLGFCDQFYFSSRFRQLCGTSPQKYRKDLRPQRYLSKHTTQE